MVERFFLHGGMKDVYKRQTFIREATSDLTGERGSLMGAIQGLLLAQYEVCLLYTSRCV